MLTTLLLVQAWSLYFSQNSGLCFLLKRVLCHKHVLALQCWLADVFVLKFVLCFWSNLVVGELSFLALSSHWRALRANMNSRGSNVSSESYVHTHCSSKNITLLQIQLITPDHEALQLLQVTYNFTKVLTVMSGVHNVKCFILHRDTSTFFFFFFALTSFSPQALNPLPRNINLNIRNRAIHTHSISQSVRQHQFNDFL